MSTHFQMYQNEFYAEKTMKNPIMNLNLYRNIALQKTIKLGQEEL